jgi:hypothetical protein
VTIPLKKVKIRSALALPLTNVAQQAYLWLGGEMVIFFVRLISQ